MECKAQRAVEVDVAPRVMPPLVCGESFWVLLTAEKAKQNAERSFSQQIKPLCFADGSGVRDSGDSLMLPNAKGVQLWLFVERRKSDRRVIAPFLGQVFSRLELTQEHKLKRAKVFTRRG